MKVLAGNAAIYNQVLKNSNRAKAEDVSENKELSKVDSIKAQLEAGTYKIDLKSTAKKVAEALLTGG